MPVNAPYSIGINLIGDASRNLGLSVSFRHVAEALIHNGVDIAVFDTSSKHVVQGRDFSLQAYAVPDIRQLPHDINLFCLNIATLSGWLDSVNGDDLKWGERLNVAVVFWELSVIPVQWVPMLASFDVLLCGSWFTREAVAAQVPIALSLTLEYPLSIPGDLPAFKRTDYGIPEQAFCFYFSFDPFSGMGRKNPAAILDSFDKAFKDDPRAHLVIKVNFPAQASEAGITGEARNFMSRCELSANVTLVRMSGSYTEAMGLCNSLCDCYVSLHRAEGLGLGPMEAMMMGKPVIMTGWSGNMSYASPRGACLVPYAFSAPSGLDAPQYDRLYSGSRTWWAEPDIEVAAFWMKKVALDAEFRNQIARCGFEQISAYVQNALQCGFALDLENLRLLKRGGVLAKPDLRHTVYSVKRAEKKHWGLRLLKARRALIKNVPGAWRLFDRP